MTWAMFAYRYENCFMHFGSYQYVKFHGLKYPIVEVEIQEDPNGQYYGWIDSDGTLQGALLWPNEHLMEMCFAYGSKAEENRGKGKKVRLSVKEIK